MAQLVAAGFTPETDAWYVLCVFGWVGVVLFVYTSL